jgi:uncharacterized protein
MATAVSSVMQASPYESTPLNLVQLKRPPVAEWVPSRFNARTRHDDGSLILWNTLSGSISVFEPNQVPRIEALLKKKGVKGPEEGIIQYLHERGFLVSKGIDELKKLRMLIGQKQYRSDALEIIAMTSEDCNFRCVYCYEDFDRGTMIPEVREGIKNLVRSRMNDVRYMNLSYFGGEPLYGWEAVEDLGPFFMETAREKKMSYWSHMTTNGYLLTLDKAEQLFEWGCRDFQITIDGIEEDHDKRRVGRDGSGTWRTIMDNLCAMRDTDHQFLVRIRHNFDPDSLPHIGEFLDVLQKEFAGDRRFKLAMHAIGKWGGANDDNLNTCGVEAKDALVQIERSARERNVNMRAGVGGMAGVGTQLCYAARPHNFLIGADGKVMKCTVALDKDDRNIIGKIFPDGRMELDQDRLAAWTDPYWENDKVCKSCHVVPMCQGSSCPLVRLDNPAKRPCLPVKGALHDFLVTTLEQRREKARVLQVPEKGALRPPVATADSVEAPFLAAADC